MSQSCRDHSSTHRRLILATTTMAVVLLNTKSTSLILVEAWIPSCRSLIHHGGGFADVAAFRTKTTGTCTGTRTMWSPLFSTESETPQEEQQLAQERTSFDQAGASIVEEEDQKKLDETSGLIENPAYRADSAEQMREAIRKRTASMGIEKSQASADYIAKKNAEALAGGPGASSSNNDVFGGIDLSQISSTQEEAGINQGQEKWNEEMPAMMFKPEDQMTEEEQMEADPVMKLNPLQQALNELQNSKWPTPFGALTEVAAMLLVVAITGGLIIFWDRFLRNFYIDELHFLPSDQDLANYANRFDGLDLPEGWTNGMDDQGVGSQIADQMTQQAETLAKPAADAAASSTGLPEL